MHKFSGGIETLKKEYFSVGSPVRHNSCVKNGADSIPYFTKTIDSSIQKWQAMERRLPLSSPFTDLWRFDVEIHSQVASCKLSSGDPMRWRSYLSHPDKHRLSTMRKVMDSSPWAEFSLNILDHLCFQHHLVWRQWAFSWFHFITLSTPPKLFHFIKRIFTLFQEKQNWIYPECGAHSEPMTSIVGHIVGQHHHTNHTHNIYNRAGPSFDRYYFSLRHCSGFLFNINL